MLGLSVCLLNNWVVGLLYVLVIFLICVSV